MKPARDITQAQFEATLQRMGFSSERFLGYFRLPPPCDNTSVSKHNGGTRRRDQLAYLIREYEKQVKNLEAKRQQTTETKGDEL